jgi:cobalamin biosynthesis Mg chelatase CobN
MKSYSAVLAALAATASAVKFTNPAVEPEPGKPFELTWSEAQGPVTINLKGGESGNLQTIETLASDVNGESTEVTLDPSKIPSGEYAFEIIDSSDSGNPNYTVQFDFEGDAEASASESATASESTSASSASASESTTASSSSASSTASASASESDESSASPSRTPSPEDEDDEDVPDSGSARNMSPIALIFVTAAAMLYFN